MYLIAAIGISAMLVLGRVPTEDRYIHGDPLNTSFKQYTELTTIMLLYHLPFIILWKFAAINIARENKTQKLTITIIGPPVFTH